jgi:hypothetical protein
MEMQTDLNGLIFPKSGLCDNGHEHVDFVIVIFLTAE